MSRDVTAATPSAERATFLDDFSDPALARYYEVTPGIGNVVRRTDGLHYDIVRATDPPDEWSEILIGESSFACGNMADAEAANRRAANIATSPKPLRSAADQLDIFASVSFQPTQAAALSDQLRTMASAVEAGIPLPTDQPASQNIAENAPPMLVHVSDIHFGSKQEMPRTVPRGKGYDSRRFLLNVEGSPNHPALARIQNALGQAERSTKNSEQVGSQDLKAFTPASSPDR